MTTKISSASMVKEALLRGEKVSSNNWSIVITANDQVLMTAPDGRSRQASFMYLDHAVKDFAKAAGIPEKTPKPYKYPAAPKSKSVLGPDSTTNKPWKDPKVNKSPVPDGKKPNTKLGPDSTTNSPWKDPKINYRPEPLIGKGGLPDTDLGPDSVTNKPSWGFKGAKKKSSKKTAKYEVVSGEEVLYEGDVWQEAEDAFNEYVEMAEENSGMVSGAPVQILEDGEVVEEWGEDPDVNDDDTYEGTDEWMGFEASKKKRAGGFMQPEVWKGAMYLVDTNQGTFSVDVEDVGTYSEEDLESMSDEEKIELFQAYTEGKISEIFDVTIESGWFARLTAPGYMDRTEAVGPFSSKSEALAELKYMYGDDEEDEEDEEDDEDFDVEASKRSSRIVDTFAEPKLGETYTELLNKTPEDRLLANIADPEKWAVDRMAEKLDRSAKRPVKKAAPQRAFNVYLKGKLIDTVFYSAKDSVDEKEVYDSLVNHDGYDPRIEVEEEGSEVEASKKRSRKRPSKKAVNFSESFADGYSRKMDADSPEEIYHLVKAFGSEDDYDWSKMTPRQPGQMTEEEAGPIGDLAPVQAADQAAKKYWQGYYGDYGKDMTKDDDGVSKTRRDPKKVWNPKKDKDARRVRGGGGSGISFKLNGGNPSSYEGTLTRTDSGFTVSLKDNTYLVDSFDAEGYQDGMDNVDGRLLNATISVDIDDKYAAPYLIENYDMEVGDSVGIEIDPYEMPPVHVISPGFGGRRSAENVDINWEGGAGYLYVDGDSRKVDMGYTIYATLTEEGQYWYQDTFEWMPEDEEDDGEFHFMEVRDNYGKRGSKKRSLRRVKRSQQAPGSAPPGAQVAPANPATDPGMAGGDPSKAPAQPSAKPDTKPSAGAGDEGLKTLGWTPEDIQAMTPDQKQGILQLKLTKPGAQPATPAKVPVKPNQGPAQGPDTMPKQGPAQAPAPTAKRKSREAADKVKIQRAFQRLAQDAMNPMAAPVSKAPQGAPAAPANAAPPSPPPGGAVMGPDAPPKAPAKATDPSAPADSDEAKAFDIYQEVLDMDVEASSPSEIQAKKAKELMSRILSEVGMSISDIKKLFGKENLMSLFPV